MRPTEFFEAINFTISGCDVKEARKTNFILKMIMEKFDESANFKIECPFLSVSGN
jgi:hypothetical protein